MGRYWVELDPDGFYYAAEPGAHFEWSAVKLLESIRTNFADNNSSVAVAPDNFYTLPNHPWVMCRPRQTDPQWYKDSRLDNHVLRDGDEWTWSPDVTVREWEPTALPGETGYPKNKWQTVQIPESAESLFDPDWSVIQEAAGFALPSDMVVVGLAGHTPAGGDFRHCTPYIQVHSQPGPNDVAVFGFGQYLLIFASGGVTLLKSESPGGTVVRKLGAWSYEAPGGQTSPLAAHVFQQYVRSVMVIETPPAHLGVVFGGGNPAQVVQAYPFSNDEIVPVIVNENAWWVAGAAKSRLQFQVQVTGYEDATTEGYEAGFFSGDFDLGHTYKPLIEPSLDVKSALHAVAPSDISTSTTTNQYEADSSFSLEQIGVYLRDENHFPWSSDGTHYTGRWRLVLSASTAGYLSPYLRDIQLKFPVNLTPRLNSPLLLDDTQFSQFFGSTNYFDPDGKRITIDLWDTGMAILRDAGFDTRENYPVIVWEDTTGNDVPDTVRLAGWVHLPDIQEILVETEDREQLRFYRLNAKGMLSRMRSGWLILPQMVDPAGGGYVEHTYAVGEALLAAGIDITDPNQYAVATDTWAGTARSRLPGTIANRPYTMQLDSDNPWAPRYDESKLDYALRIAKAFAGWVFYEQLDGTILYHPNLFFELSLGGISYYRSLQLYYNAAAAAAAGAPGQYYLSDLTESVRPVEANSIRIQGKKDVPFRDVVIHDALGWTTPLYENFTGEPVPKTITLDGATDAAAAALLAQIALLEFGMRLVDWKLEVQLAPWDMVTADSAEVGFVAAIQGIDKGDRLITHSEVSLLYSRATSLLRTRFTCTRLPAIAGALTGGFKPYPGRMNTLA